MKHKKIIALLAAAAIMGTLAGCKAGNKPGQDPSIPFDGQQPSFETQAPVESNATQAVGKATGRNARTKTATAIRSVPPTGKSLPATVMEEAVPASVTRSMQRAAVQHSIFPA